jgi:predicted RNase H-like nuclease
VVVASSRERTRSGLVGGATVLGVDGCPGGWVGALVGPDGRIAWRFWTVDETELLLGAAGTVAIDMPIGLPDHGRRRCDIEARGRLGAGRSSVFPVPTRSVLDVEDYAEACALARGRSEAAPSKQLWGLRPRIRRLDAVVTPVVQARVVECHPEVAFVELCGTRPASKRSARGIGERIAALGVSGAELASAPLRAGPDDALDALICAWTARRWSEGRAVILGGDERDAHGLRMQIVA